MDLVVYIIVIVVASGIVWKGSDGLESSSIALAAHYALPPIVQGGIVTAIGSSFPELSSTVLSTLVHGEFELGVSIIVGSAIFNILVIPGVAGLAGAGLKADREIVYKDAQFYITSVAVLLLTFSLAVIYNPVETEPLTGDLTRTLAILPVALYGLYLFLQQQETLDYTPPEAAEEVRVGREWLRLIVSLVVIVAGVEGLVRAAIGLGDYFGTPSFLWGITVLAAATSLPDLFVSLKAARRGAGTVSLANVLGSNIFDLLVAVPVGVLIAGTASIDYAVAAPMMGVLTLATIALFALLRTGLVLERAESVFLLVLYALFVVWMGLETAGVTSVVV